MRVAVTGADGFIGRACVSRLETEGHTTVAIDRRYGIDVLDLGDALEGCDAVIHLAGMLGTAELYDHPDLAIQTNVIGSLRVLEQCRDRQMAYVGITMPQVWANIYQATKDCARRLATAFHRDFGVPVTHICAFNAYGPGQAHGEGHPQKILPTFASAVWRGEPVPIWGDGLQTVDLVHVDHLALCLTDAATSRDVRYGVDEVFDGGSGQEMTVLEVAHLVASSAGKRLVVEFAPMRLGETPGTRLRANRPGPCGFDHFDPTRFVKAVNAYQPALV